MYSEVVVKDKAIEKTHARAAAGLCFVAVLALAERADLEDAIAAALTGVGGGEEDEMSDEKTG